MVQVLVLELISPEIRKRTNSLKLIETYMCISKIQTMKRLSCTEVRPSLLFSAIKYYEDMNIDYIDKS